MSYEHKPSLQSVLLLPLAGLLLLVSIYSIYLVASAGGSVEAKRVAALEAAKPPVVEALVVQLSAACKQCANPYTAVSALEKAGVNVSSRTVAVESAEGTKLVNQYRLTRLPAVVATGEIAKASAAFGSEWSASGSARVWLPAAPVYFDVSKGSFVGLVKAKQVVDSACTACTRFDGALDALQKNGVAIDARETLEANSTQGQALIRQYKLTVLPALILSPDALEYSTIKQGWAQVGSVESDALVSRVAYPPFENRTENRTVGLVRLTRLTKQACVTCYSASIHDEILARLGIAIAALVASLVCGPRCALA